MSVIVNIMSEPFAWVDWMIAERQKNGWSQADLARKSHLTRTTISDYEKRIRPNPDIRALTQISEALGYPGDALPRVAGLLPDEPDYDEWVEKTAHKLSKLSPRLRSVADRLIDGLIDENEVNQKSKPKTKSARA